MAGNLVQVGADGRVRVASDLNGKAGIVVAGAGDPCCGGVGGATCVWNGAVNVSVGLVDPCHPWVLPRCEVFGTYTGVSESVVNHDACTDGEKIVTVDCSPWTVEIRLRCSGPGGGCEVMARAYAPDPLCVTDWFGLYYLDGWPKGYAIGSVSDACGGILGIALS